MGSIIITGANTGIGFECALQMAKIAPHEQIILACRNVQAAHEAIQKITEKTNHKNLICLPLDLASLQSIRDFKTAFSKLPNPVIAALVNNAGLTDIGKTTYTTDGFEITFGTNHLGPFYLTLLLLPFMGEGASITFTTSGTHDPAEKTGIEPPVYTNGKDLAFPKDSGEKDKTVGQRRYTTSKLCNILTTYALHEKLANRNIKVNAYDPRMVPGTGLTKTYPPHFRFLWKHVMPALTWLIPDANSLSRAGSQLANLAFSGELRHLNGIYYSHSKVKPSSTASYNKAYQAELWASSIALIGIKQEETDIPLF